jgi:hypothetical protein
MGTDGRTADQIITAAIREDRQLDAQLWLAKMRDAQAIGWHRITKQQLMELLNEIARIVDRELQTPNRANRTPLRQTPKSAR